MPPSPIHTPLVVRFGAFGDMVLIIPLLKALQQRYGQPCDLVSAGPWTEPLMQRVPACGSMHLITSRKTPYWINRSQWQFVAWLRRRPACPVYVFESDEKTHWLLQRGGVRPEWICSLRELPRLPGENILQHALRLGQETPAALQGSLAFPVDLTAKPTARPTLSGADRADCRSWIERNGLAGVPLVLIQPGNKKTMRRGNRQRSSNVKYWPEDSWARVIAAVRQALPASRVILCGSPAERSLAEDIRQQSQCDGVVVATDDLPIPRLLALQEVAHSMISIDTGPAHGAAAMGCPLVVMFARIDPLLYAPTATTAPVRIVSPDPSIGDASMTAIPAETVIAAWRQMAGR